MTKVEALQTALAGLMPYRAHFVGCDEPMTDFCTCGLREAADAARAALTQPSEVTKVDAVIVALPGIPQEAVYGALDMMWRICGGGAKLATALCLRLASALLHIAYQHDAVVLPREEWDRLCAAAYHSPLPVWTPPPGSVS
jgi:hypothetical protein